MTDLAVLIQKVIKFGNSEREGIAAYIENGGDLSKLGDHERKVLALLVRGKSPRKRGRPPQNEKRDRDILHQLAYLKGNGLPVSTNEGSQRERSVPVVEFPAKTGAEVIADVCGLKEQTVIHIWDNRDKDDPELVEWEAKGKRFKDRVPW
jgi:hypothetical protein